MVLAFGVYILQTMNSYRAKLEPVHTISTQHSTYPKAGPE